jgi:hypothetical protein
LQSTQTDKQFFGRGEAVWSLFDGRFKNFFGLDYTSTRTGASRKTQSLVSTWPLQLQRRMRELLVPLLATVLMNPVIRGI